MTYKELADSLDNLESEQMEMQVMALVDEEYYPVSSIVVQDKDSNDEGDINGMRDGHPFLEVT